MAKRTQKEHPYPFLNNFIDLCGKPFPQLKEIILFSHFCTCTIIAKMCIKTLLTSNFQTTPKHNSNKIKVFSITAWCSPAEPQSHTGSRGIESTWPL